MGQQASKGFIGLARETLKGTYVAPTTSDQFIPYTSLTDVDNYARIEDKAVRAAPLEVFDLVDGPASSAIDFSGYVFVESIHRVLWGLLGDYTQLGTAAGGKTGTMAALAAGANTGVYTVGAGGAPIVGDILQIDVGNLAEVRTLTIVTGAGPYNLTWSASAPLAFGHAGAAAAASMGATYDHVSSLLNSGDTQPVSMSAVTGNGYNARGYAGVQFDSVTLKWARDGFFEYTAKGIGYKSSVPATPVPVFPAPPAQAAWASSITVAAVARPQLEAFEITIPRVGTVAQHNLDGTQDPYKIWAGDLGAPNGKMTLVYEDDTDFTRYLTNAKPAVVMSLFQGAGAAARGMSVTMSKTGFKTGGKILRGQKFVEVELPFEALGNVTDVGGSGGYSPLKIATRNAQPVYFT